MQPARIALWLLTATCVVGGCTLERDLDLGGDNSALLGRFDLHNRIGSSDPRTCVGAACTQIRAMDGVGPGASACLQGGGAHCVAKLEVRLVGATQLDGPPLPPGATVPLPGGPAAALPSAPSGDIERVLRLRNVAAPGQAAALRVLAVTIEERCGGKPCAGAVGVVCTRGPADRPCGEAQATRLVPASAAGMHEHNLTLRRLASVPGDREVIVRVIVGGDPRFAVTPWHGMLKPRIGEPHLVPAQSVLAMPWKGPNTVTHAAINLTNTGDAPAELYGLELAGHGGFDFRLADEPTWHTQGTQFAAPVQVLPQHSVAVAVRFQPDDTAKKHASLTVISDTPGAAPTVHIVANGAAPCMELAPAKMLTLGTLQVGGCAERKLEVRSCGTGMLALTGLAVVAGAGLPSAQPTSPGSVTAAATADLAATLAGADAQQTVHPSLAAPVLIPPGGARKLRIRYCPTAPGALDAQVELRADGLPPRSLPVQAAAVASLCPVAILEIAEGADVLPLTTLHLSGAASTAPVAGALTYHWTVQQPAGSLRSLSPNPNVVAPTFTPAVSGPHTFCLTVRDAAGHPSCSPACSTVQVVPEDGLHVELLWHTPSDPDETDTGPGAGSDLDLHVTHALATGPDLDCDGAGDPWFHSSHDAYWANSAPSWGSAAPNAEDDPTVDLDDTDGAGPELLSLGSPEAGVAGYLIGVHYWNDHGFGPVQARVRVFLGGTLAASFGSVTLSPLDMWTVGRVAFQASATAAPSITPCWQSKPACEGGQHWQSGGAACVASCYLPANPPATSHAPACGAAP